MARAQGIEKARAALLPFGPDSRVPMRLTRLYADGGAFTEVGINRGSPHDDTASGFMTVSGYLVDMP